MKEFRLSTSADRVTGISIAAATIVCLGLLVSSLRDQLGLMILCGLFGLLIAVLLVCYVVNVLRAACIVDMENQSMEVRGTVNFTVDISKVVSMRTAANRMGHTVTRVLVFTDAEDQTVAVVPTLFLSRQGVQAEPMAKEMAKELGIEFVDTVPLWEYDEEAGKQHRKEVAEQQKREVKERRKARMEQFTKNFKK